MARMVTNFGEMKNGRFVGGGTGYKPGGNVKIISESGNKTICVNNYNFTHDPLYDLAHNRLVEIVNEVERTTEATEDHPPYARGDGWTTSGFSMSHPLSEQLANVLKTLEQIKYLSDTAASQRYSLSDLIARLNANVELSTPKTVTGPLYDELAKIDMQKAKELWTQLEIINA